MNKGLILIIDQSPETRAMYGDYFRHHGYGVAEAADGQEGIRLVRELKPDLVVTELSGDEGWLDAIRTIANDSPDERPALIACSTRIDASWPYAPPGLAVDMAVPKPITPRSLLEQARQVLVHRSLGLRVVAV
jgi:CheY-like chemotaxis protein